VRGARVCERRPELSIWADDERARPVEHREATGKPSLSLPQQPKQRLPVLARERRADAGHLEQAILVARPGRGETEERLYMLDAWREGKLYSERERAALLWAEAVTKVQEGVPDDVFAEVSKQFDEIGMSNLTYLVAAINAWNRMAVSGRATPGRYQSKLTPADNAPTP